MLGHGQDNSTHSEYQHCSHCLPHGEDGGVSREGRTRQPPWGDVRQQHKAAFLMASTHPCAGN